jgi:ribosome-binding factor A
VKHSQARLAHEIRERIATILRTQVGDPRLAEVTLNEVRVAPDGSYARIFWGTLGAPAAAAEALEKAKPYLRRCLAAELHTRRVPELDFRLDDTLARAQRVEDVMRELERERQRVSVPPAGTAKHEEDPA